MFLQTPCFPFRYIQWLQKRKTLMIQFHNMSIFPAFFFLLMITTNCLFVLRIDTLSYIGGGLLFSLTRLNRHSKNSGWVILCLFSAISLFLWYNGLSMNWNADKICTEGGTRECWLEGGKTLMINIYWYISIYTYKQVSGNIWYIHTPTPTTHT